jgi:hypothetical protein
LRLFRGWCATIWAVAVVRDAEEGNLRASAWQLLVYSPRLPDRLHIGILRQAHRPSWLALVHDGRVGCSALIRRRLDASGFSRLVTGTGRFQPSHPAYEGRDESPEHCTCKDEPPHGARPGFEHHQPDEEPDRGAEYDTHGEAQCEMALEAMSECLLTLFR